MASKSAKPIKMWIDGKCFSVKQFKRKNAKNKAPEAKSSGDTLLDSVSERLCGSLEFVAKDDGKLLNTFQLPKVYCSKLKYHPEFKLRDLEAQTSTQILIPKQTGKVEIIGDSEDCISDARDLLHSVIARIRQEQSAMQFISIPILSEEVRGNFEKFKAQILEEKDIEGLEESIFQSSLKLHLTVVVFALFDDTEKQQAIKCLEDCKTEILEPFFSKHGPLHLRAKGLECMNNETKKVHVLYANVEFLDQNEEKDLQSLLNSIAEFAYERGLTKQFEENVKIHMTLINTKYRGRKIDSDTPSPKRKWAKRRSFDATKILEKYKDFDFGQSHLDSVHLSLMSSKGEDGFYKPLHIVKM